MSSTITSCREEVPGTEEKIRTGLTKEPRSVRRPCVVGNLLDRRSHLDRDLAMREQLDFLPVARRQRHDAIVVRDVDHDGFAREARDIVGLQRPVPALRRAVFRSNRACAANKRTGWSASASRFPDPRESTGPDHPGRSRGANARDRSSADQGRDNTAFRRSVRRADRWRDRDPASN